MNEERLKLEIELLEKNSQSKPIQSSGLNMPMNVLLAIHSKGISSHLTAFIRSQYPQWDIRHANDALEAYALLQQRSADAMLCEFCMPYLSGFGLLNKLEKHATLNQMPVVMISSEPLEKIIDPKVSILSDPFNTKALNEALSGLMDHLPMS